MSPSSPEELSQEIAHQITEKIPAGKIYFRPRSFTNSLDNTVPVLSTHLALYLRAELSSCGFDITADNPDYILTGSFLNEENKISFFFNVEDIHNGKIFNFTSSIKNKKLSPDLLKENLRTKTVNIASDLACSPSMFNSHLMNDKKISVFINPLVDANLKSTSPFSENFLFKIKNEIAQYNSITIAKPIPVAKRGTRALRRKAKKISNLKGSQTVVTDSEAILDGRYFISADHVTVNLEIIDRDGKVISSSEENIPLSMISLPIEDKQIKKQANLLGLHTSQPLPDDMIRISTAKGYGDVIYHAGETVTLFIQVAAPLYVYIYAVDSDNNINLIFPTEEDRTNFLQPRTLYTIPPEEAETDIMVECRPETPCGTDNILVFASDKNISLPKLAVEVDAVNIHKGTRSLRRTKKDREKIAKLKRINPVDLVDYFHSAAAISGARLYGDGLYLRTKK
ncbi:DUF4384 domain-containing protein [Desulfovibrio sp. UCD-KL4C]|uniref:DUF4384 domain-containing protein n=1 Tax=Desulfovibrio sp. UCD-KL4C TaxID=2578120 RepID=UPI0025BB9D9D|nr:DUF4384 domain-containing protein [Desulfovibrio sp. UCD-KL4C]